MLRVLTPLIVGFSLVLSSGTASAGVLECGNVAFSHGADCEMRTGSLCRSSCTPVQVQATCAAELVAQCEQQCEVEGALDCSTDCHKYCDVNCTLGPVDFDCEGYCQKGCATSCRENCEGEISGEEAVGQCQTSCRTSCSSECSDHCSSVVPEDRCDTQCEATCEGQCDARANMACQVLCQAEGFSACEVATQQRCDESCDEPEGALFCNGQFIEHGDNLEHCVSALREELGIRVVALAETGSDCSGDSCVAHRDLEVACAGPGCVPDQGSAGDFHCTVGALRAASSRNSGWMLLSLMLTVFVCRVRRGFSR